MKGLRDAAKMAAARGALDAFTKKTLMLNVIARFFGPLLADDRPFGNEHGSYNVAYIGLPSLVQPPSVLRSARGRLAWQYS